MRVLQLIDTLQVGGAERMAVNFANALVDEMECSAVVTSRQEGPLRKHLKENVPFLCLHKKRAIDIGATFKLRTFCKRHKINIVHAHGTSYFTAFVLKLVYPEAKIVWHEHAGARSFESVIKNKVLWLCVKFFSGIIVVNQELEHWCKSVLQFDRVIYLPNFTIGNANEKPETSLHGTAGKRIVCLANLRHPKNHTLLIETAVKLSTTHPDWTFHFIGKDLQDDYSDALKALIGEHKLETTVYIYGLKEDTDHILDQAAIAVIASSTEGLPVALLEYGLHEKAVVVTDVGEIPSIVSNGNNGFVVPSNDSNGFAEALSKLIADESLRTKFGLALQQTIQANHSEKAVITKYINWLKQI